MKRLGLILSAAMICVVASSQAQASWSVIRWKSGFCQVWDNAIPTKPWPNDYKLVSRPHKTFAGAMARRTKLVAKKRCW
jgi:hypothetical protein